MPNEVSLREVVESDLPVLFEHQADPESARMADFPSRDRDAFMAHWTRILGDDAVTTRAILGDDQLVGNIVSFNRDGVREVGYWIGREHWGRGIATRALAAFLEIEKSRPLHAYVAKHNVASVRVLEKCGFTVRGECPGPYADVASGAGDYLLVLDPRPETGGLV